MTHPPRPATDALRIRAAQIGMFETPILHRQVTDAAALNAALRTTILAQADAAPSLNRSNVGGWHSATAMLAWGGPAAVQLSDLAIRTVRRLSHFESHDPVPIRVPAIVYRSR